MMKQELLENSALRLLNQTPGHGLRPGEVGVFASRKGVGKTACLVHLSLDQMLRERSVIHLSFRDRTDHIDAWYRNIFQELALRFKLDHKDDIFTDLMHRRMILKFQEEAIASGHLAKSLEQLLPAAHFAASVMVVDGYEFHAGSKGDFEILTKFAALHKMPIWLSATIADEESLEGKSLPPSLAAYDPFFSVVFGLTSHPNHIRLTLLKPGSLTSANLQLELDPRTLLVKEE
jgi:hypothetical protein